MTIVAIDPTNKRQAAETAIRQKYADQMQAVVKPYLETERETWFTQVAQANAYLADNTASVPMIAAIAQGRGISLSDLITKIKQNETAYNTAIGTILGQQQAELDGLG